MATPCVVCEEVCPTSPKAIWLEPADAARADGTVVRVQRPRLDPERCIGCGLCEAKCPVASPAAVRVTRAGESRDPRSAFTLRRHVVNPCRALRFAGVAAVLAAAPVTFGPEPSLAARTRPPALAGSWYPEGRALLVAGAHFLMRLAASAPTLSAKPVAFVVPHAGWSYSGLAAATAFRALKPGDFERVVVVAPSHHGSFRGYALDDATAYRTPMGDVPLCDGALAALQGAHARVVPGVADGEHAVEIELPFLQATLGRFCLVPVLVGDTDDADERAFAERLATLDDGRTLFVFSSDFAHYGPRFDFQPFGALSPAVLAKVRAMDDRGAELLGQVNARGFRDYLQETGNTICGRHGLATLLELLPRIAPRARAVPLAHYASGDLPG